jgi:hypothetical protein
MQSEVENSRENLNLLYVLQTSHFQRTINYFLLWNEYVLNIVSRNIRYVQIILPDNCVIEV